MLVFESIGFNDQLQRFLGLFIIFSVGSLIFDWNKTTHVVTCSFIYPILVFLCLKLVKIWADFLHRWYQVDQIKRVRNELLIGFGAIFFSGILPRIALFMEDTKDFVTNYCVIISASTTFFAYSMFIEHFGIWCYWKQINAKPLYYLIFFLSVFQLEDVFSLTPNRLNYEQMAVINSCCGPVAALGLTFLFDILMGAIVSKTDVTKIERGGYSMLMLTELLNVEIEPFETKIVAGKDCEECSQKYTEKKIPRVLKQCGHTICEGCVKCLLEKSLKKSVVCPVCQVSSGVIENPNPPKQMSTSDYIQKKLAEKQAGK